MMKVKLTHPITGAVSEESAHLTTEHAASSYGQSVMVVDSGAIDHATWMLHGGEVTEATAEERAQFNAWITRFPGNRQ
jgi:hypothetical protein